jgi:hypothetical protein
VTGHYADGSVRDLTAEADFGLEPGGVAAVSAAGVVTPAAAAGAARLRVAAAGRTAEVPVRVSGGARARPVSYRLDVTAVLSKAGCNTGACHGNLNGKGGFRLSLRGDDPRSDLESLTRDAFGRRIDRNDPARSLIVRKPTGRLPTRGASASPAIRPRPGPCSAGSPPGPATTSRAPRS